MLSVHWTDTLKSKYKVITPLHTDSLLETALRLKVTQKPGGVTRGRLKVGDGTSVRERALESLALERWRKSENNLATVEEEEEE
ncbi:hypothetical protein EYF80_056705 [Liparis tanakae]|uniref:Uncharacterized protein n=1 Tax=Liparis tanakae TaxID=230148 RepID=A0A4Z2EWX9_9TELE|nr:hypothetical protein EYF80_056705 [Liparis tanakae]